jgi:hypothetical protein
LYQKVQSWASFLLHFHSNFITPPHMIGIYGRLWKANWWPC